MRRGSQHYYKKVNHSLLRGFTLLLYMLYLKEEQNNLSFKDIVLLLVFRVSHLKIAVGFVFSSAAWMDRSV